MSRIFSSLILIGMLAGCSSDYAASDARHAPPSDPADYHGVPTDDRPPTLAPASTNRAP
jgi:hypothetical protein